MDQDEWGTPLRPNGMDGKPGDILFVVIAALMVAAMVGIILLGAFER
jgi:hypothetical protein